MCCWGSHVEAPLQVADQLSRQVHLLTIVLEPGRPGRLRGVHVIRSASMLLTAAGESVQTGAVTIDLQKMSHVQVAADHNSAWVQGGANMGQ
jgi:hypothetical protein